MDVPPLQKSRLESLDRPVDLTADRGEPAWGSDVLAETLSALSIDFATLNPGASFRGLHDSIVNYLGNSAPQLLLCLHEEGAVAIAHGYAKVSGRPMAVLLHSNVGLMHGSMAIYNAWCDRVPMLIIGANGPMDAARRRPWIDWIHSHQDQAALIRDFVKWDDQPASLGAAVDALLQGARICRTEPFGPVYVNIDTDLQEGLLESGVAIPDPSRFGPLTPPVPASVDLDRATALLRDASRPILLAGRVGRGETGWRDRIDLAERLGACVLTDLKTAAAFPTDHPLHGPPPGMFPAPESLDILRKADAILSLDWIDLPGTVKSAFGSDSPPPIVQVSMEHQLNRGPGQESFGVGPVDIHLPTTTEIAISELLARLPEKAAEPKVRADETRAASPPETDSPLTVGDIAVQLDAIRRHRPICLIRLPLSWDGAMLPFSHPLDYLGYDGGGGIGSGPGMAVGAALALRGDKRLPVAVIGDGDFMMGATAIWTAVRFRVPLLILVADNRSFYNDEVHQERVAVMRNRPVANKGIGQRIEDPPVDIAAIARAQGAAGYGPVETRDALSDRMKDAVAHVESGGVAVVDCIIERGYAPAMRAAMRAK